MIAVAELDNSLLGDISESTVPAPKPVLAPVLAPPPAPAARPAIIETSSLMKGMWSEAVEEKKSEQLKNLELKAFVRWFSCLLFLFDALNCRKNDA